MSQTLWQRTKHVATTYTGTFIAVMLLNQLVFFGFCLNPICLIAAMPHVLFITVVIGSWLNKHSGWGKDDEDAEKSSTVTTKPVTSTPIDPPLASKIEGALNSATENIATFGAKARGYSLKLEAKTKYSSERYLVDAALAHAQRALDLEKRKASDPTFAAAYDQALRDWDESKPAQKLALSADQTPRTLAHYTLPANLDGVHDINAIQKEIEGIAADHSAYLETVKQRLDSAADLKPFFEKALREMGGEDVLEHILSLKPTRVPALSPTPVRPLARPSARDRTNRARHGRKQRQAAGLYGSLSHELSGNWTGGFACDIHTLASRRIGTDKHGNAIYDNTRSAMGQLVYDLKYASDFSTVPKIVQLLRQNITIEGFDYIIPAPASKNRPRQPVDAIAQALGARIDVPVLSGFLDKADRAELKAMIDPREREDVLQRNIHIARTDDISGKNLLLIDDLYRSGATLRACCHVLKQRKAGEIWVLTLTRTRRSQ